MTEWNQQHFRTALLDAVQAFAPVLATSTGEWTVKGFIDIYRKIYPLTGDTKVVSKLIELMLFPLLFDFAQQHGYELIVGEHQNYYPDISLIVENGTKIAIDLKSTYRLDKERVNGFTLGAFTGYFRDRSSSKNTTFPYGDYAAHFVLGIIYTRMDEFIDYRQVYSLDDLLSIASVVKDFEFLLQEKWRLASDRPGSGNTKNIGSIKEIQALLEGQGPFAAYGEAIFDDYWMNYLTVDMARAIDSTVPYHNLREYIAWRERAPLR